MLFNTYTFILAFLPVAALGFIWLSKKHPDAGMGWLVFASLFFYGWWNPKYLVLIIGSMVVNYFLGTGIIDSGSNRRRARAILVFGVVLNLGLLGYFKYANFFLENLTMLAGTDFQAKSIVLPLAISFFTFQQIAYLADAYQGESERYRFLHYALFVTFFPQLIAGPIVHHREMMPQFLNRETISPKLENFLVGLMIFSIGLFKKSVLADGVAVYATPVFGLADSGVQVSFFQAWGGALAYTCQLYFDFSGYSDMAIGAARIFGIRLPLNFHSPYRATSISEFWRRWHMTLSRFLRDYIYIALGGNRHGQARRYSNLLITMLLGGLWHGAGWNFVIWGGLHGFYLCVNHGWQYFTRRLGIRWFATSTIWSVISWMITFLSVVVGWVFFRAESFEGARSLLGSMVGLNGIDLPAGILIRLGSLGGWLQEIGISEAIGGGSSLMFTYLWVLFLLVIAIAFPNTQQLMLRFKPALTEFAENFRTTVFFGNPLEAVKVRLSGRWLFFFAVILTLGLMSLSEVSEFLYFQF